MAYNAPSTISTGDLITAAIWNADVVANPIAIYAGAMSVSSQAVGDILYASSTTQLGRVGIGSANKVLTSTGSAPQWVTQIANAALPTNIDVGGTLDVTGAATLDSTLAVSSTAADAIDVAGGITAGTGNVALVGTDGKINGPLSSTIIDDLSGANLTTLNASNISSGTLAVARGGTGASTLTDGGILLGSGTSAITATAVLGDGEILIGDGSGDPTTLDVGAAGGITILGTIATGVWEGTDIGVAHGGTGASTLTDGGVLLGSGTGAVTAMAVLADGEMIVGDGSGDPVAESGATLRTSIGVGTGDSPQLTAVELGHATDTTLARASAGDVNIEGNIVYRAGGTDVPVADGGTGASTLTDGGVLLGSGTAAVTAMAVLADGEMIVGDGSTDPVAESGATLRTSIGVGTGDTLTLTGVAISGSGVAALDITGGITVGSGDVALVGTDGKINGPLSSTIIDDLSGANLTTLNASNISSGTLANARLPTNVDLGGTLDVTGATKLDGAFEVSGHTFLDGTLSIGYLNSSLNKILINTVSRN